MPSNSRENTRLETSRVLAQFRGFLTAQQLSKKTIENYVSDIRRFFSVSSISSLERQDLDEAIQTYKLGLLEKQAPMATMQRHMASIKQFASFLRQIHHLEINHDSLEKIIPGSGLRLEKERLAEPPLMRLSWHKEFKSALEKQGCSSSTISNYLADIGNFEDWLSPSSPLEIRTRAIFGKYSSFLRANGLSEASIRRKLYSLKRFYSWATDTKRIKTNPVSSVLEILAGETIKKARRVLDFFQRDSLRAKLKRAESSASEKKRPLENIYLKYTSWSGSSYLHLAVLLLFVVSMSLFGYDQFFADVRINRAFPTSFVEPRRYLSFQGRLTDSAGTPITISTSFQFDLFNVSTGGTTLWTGSCSIVPDQDGVFSTVLGETCGSAIPSSIFSENQDVYLQVTVAAQTLTPRQRIATVGYALNTETLQGYPPSSPAVVNSVPVFDNNGDMLISISSPAINSSSGTFQLGGQALSLITNASSNGNITLQPDGTGSVQLIGGTTTQDFIDITNANLTTGSLVKGTVGNSNTGYKFLSFLGGSSPSEKFSVNALGAINTVESIRSPVATISATYSGATPLQINGTGGGIFSIANSGAITASNTIAGLTGITSSGTITFSGLSTGVIWSNSGVLTSEAQLAVSRGGTGQNWSAVAQGAIPFFSGTGVMSTLAPGTAGYVLQTNGAGSDPSWISTASITGTNYWQLNASAPNDRVISPGNSWWDLAIGGNATSSAKFQVFGATGNATTSGTLAFGGNSLTTNRIVGRNNAGLQLGDSQTGNIVIPDVNLGLGTLTPTKKLEVVGETKLWDDLEISIDGSSEASPRLVGFSDISTGEALRVTFGDEGNGFQSAFNRTVDIMGFHGVRILGDRNSATAPAFSSISDVSLQVMGTTAASTVTRIMGASSQTGPLLDLTDNAYATLTRFDANGYLSIGGNTTGGLHLKSFGDIGVSTNGSTISPNAPRVIGFYDLTAGEGGRVQFGDAANALQAGYDRAMDIYSYNPVRIVGNRQVGTGLDFVTITGVGFRIQNTVAGVVGAQIDGGSGQTADLLQFRNNSGTILSAVDKNGFFAIGGVGTALAPIHAYRNNTSTDAIALIEQDGSGDAALRFLLSGGESVIVGIDNSDSDSFVIGEGTALGGTTRFRIDGSTGNITVAQDLLVDGGDIGLTADVDLLGLAANAFTVRGSATINTLGAGATNTVVTQNAGLLQTRTIDSRVWGASLVDGTSSTGNVAYWSDADTLTGEAQLAVSRGGTGQNWSAVAQGALPFFSGTGVMSTLAAGTDGYILKANGAAANPSWVDPVSLGLVNYWQQNNKVVAPGNTTWDLAIGGNATSSAKFQVFGATGNATTSGTLAFGGNSLTTNRIVGRNNAGLQLGDSQTGNIVIPDVNLGLGTLTPTNKLEVVGDAKLWDDLFISTNGTSLTSPRLIGFTDLTSGEGVRVQFGDEANAFQNGFNQALDIYSYHTLRLMGDRNSATAPAFTTKSDASVQVLGSVTGNPVLQTEGPSGQTGDLQQWRVNGSNLSVIDNAGWLGVGDTDPESPLDAYVNNSSTTALLQLEQDGSGDSAQQFLLTGGQTFSMGIDNSTSDDDFVIAASATLGTNNRLVINGSSGLVNVIQDLQVSGGDILGDLGEARISMVDVLDRTQINNDLLVTRYATISASLNVGGFSTVKAGIGNAAFSGDVGIGIASATTKLHVYGNNSSTTPFGLIEQDGSGDSALQFSLTGTQQFTMGIDNSSGNNNFVISDHSSLGTNDRLVIDGSNGYIGIGMNPTAQLSIAGATSTISNSSGDITINSASGTIDFAGDSISNMLNIQNTGQIRVANQTSNPGSPLGEGSLIWRSDLDEFYFYTGSTWDTLNPWKQSGGFLTTTSQTRVNPTLASAADIFRVQNGGSNRFTVGWDGHATISGSLTVGTASLKLNDYGTYSTINSSGNLGLNTSSGNVGIGTTAPAGKLEINSAANVLAGVNTPSNYHLNLHSNSNTIGEAVGLTFGISSGGASGASIYHIREGSGSYGSLVFGTKASGGSVAEKMRLTSDGRLGIGTTTPGSHALSVVGTAGLSTGTAWTNTSDRRLKTELGGLYGSALDKIMALRPVAFEWNALHAQKFGAVDPGKNYGFIAQEVAEVIPEFISKDSEGYYWYNPSGMEAILTAGLQEQQQMINALRSYQLTDQGELLSTAELLEQQSQQLATLTSITSQLSTNLAKQLETVTQLAAYDPYASGSADLRLNTLLVNGATQLSDASVSGTLSAENLETQTLSAREIIAERITGIDDQLRAIAQQELANVVDLLVPAHDASTSAALAMLNNTSAADAAQTAWQDLMTQDIFEVTAQSTKIGEFSISGTSIALSDSLEDPRLFLQPSGRGKLNLLAGLMEISDTGSVSIQGDLLVNGSIYALSIQTDEISIGAYQNISEGSGVEQSKSWLTQQATSSAQLATSTIGTGVSNRERLLAFVNSNGELVGEITASGSAKFREVATNRLIIASGPDQQSTVSGSLISSSPVGQAVLPAGTTELFVPTTAITGNSIIQLTPLADSANQVLFVQAKQDGAGFTVALRQPITADLPFSYWIVETLAAGITPATPGNNLPFSPNLPGGQQ